MATKYEMQLLPSKEQVDVLIKALKKFSALAVLQSESEIADELQLEILKKRRENRDRGN